MTNLAARFSLTMIVLSDFDSPETTMRKLLKKGDLPTFGCAQLVHLWCDELDIHPGSKSS